MNENEKSSSGFSATDFRKIDVCQLCGQEVDKNDPTTWKQVIGWVGGPRKDSMRLREDTGKYAHNDCVLKRQRGIAEDQSDLFEQTSDPMLEENTLKGIDTDIEDLGLE